MHAVRAVVVLLASSVISGGCGGSNLGSISGEIKYDSKIIEQGAITFTPADGSGPSAGSAIVDGKYAVPNVPVGRAKVNVSGVKATGKRKMYDDPKAPLVQTSSEYMPGKYNEATILIYEVKVGIQTWNLDLTK